MKKISILFLIFFLSYFIHSITEIFNTLNLYGRFDWDVYTFHVEFLRKSFIEFDNLFPLWNPYYGAGFPTWENPSSKIFSITHLLSLFFPSLTALKISFVVYFLISTITNFHSFRLYTKYSYISCLLFICILQFSGYIFQKFYAGHLNQIQIILIPSLIFYSLTFLKNRSKFLAINVLIISYILLSEGSIYPITQSIFLFFFLSIRETLLAISKRKIITNVLILGSFVIVILSSKILAVFSFVNYYGRFFKPDLYNLNLNDYFVIFFGSSQHPLLSRSISNMQYFYWEYGNYIGLLPLVLFPISIYNKKDYILNGLFIIILLIMAGNFNIYSPANLLEQMPIYSLERVYPRWSFSAVFLYSWIISSSFEKLTLSISKKNSILLSILLLMILIFHMYDLRKKNTKYLNEIFTLEILNQPITNKKQYPIKILTLNEYGSDSKMLPALKNNYSIQDIYENIQFNLNVRNKDDSNYCGEFFTISKCSEVIPSIWKVDSYTFENLKENELLIFNQKYYHSFSTSVKDLEPCSYNGYLAVISNKELFNLKVYYSIYNFWFNKSRIKNCP
jgi:hypothetical protein